MERGGFLIIALFLILIPLISAEPPFQTATAETGLDVRFPPLMTAKINQSVTAHTHVYNRSNGLPVTNATTQCFLHLYNSTGNHLVKQEMEYVIPENEWEQVIGGGNLTDQAGQSFIIWCNATFQGGFVSGALEVTPTGTTLETSESNLYIVILIATFLLFLAFLFPAIKLPYSNKINNDGSITRISKAKYLKLLSVWFAYGFLMWFLQTLNGISTSFIKLTYLSNFITNIFTYSQLFSVWITILILTIILIEIWKDIILSKAIKRYGKAFMDGRLQ